MFVNLRKVLGIKGRVMESEAVIYLSDQRGRTQTRTHQGFHTFNFGSYQNAHRKPFKNLIAFNDETLMPGACLTYSIPDDHLIFLLPVIGGMGYKFDNEESEHFLEVGQSKLLHVSEACVLTISNVFQNDLINFICCWFSANQTGDQQSITSTFDLDASKKSLVHIFTSTNIKGYIGKFAGRDDFNLKLQCSNGAVFAFVLEGAFELQNRLLQQKDGLSINNVSELEFEALSNDAIILVFEL